MYNDWFFMFRYLGVVAKLSELLGVKFYTDEENDSPIGRGLSDIIRYHDAGLYDIRDCELARVQLLIKHLEEIKAYNNDLLDIFRKKINRDDANYYGFRFEVAIAASLIRKDINFIKTESPDFAIKYDGKNIFIETTTSHIESKKEKSIKEKIRRAVNRKSRKQYCDLSTALFIDVTNIVHHGLIRDELRTDKDLRNYVTKLLKNTSFGSILLFVYICNLDSWRFELDYIRLDSREIDPVLKKFLDRYYPKGKYLVHHGRVLRKG